MIGPYRGYPSAYAPRRAPAPERPTARFAYDPAAPVVDEDVTFNAAASSGQINTFEWQVLETNQRANGNLVVLAFAAARRHTVILTAIGPGGRHQSGQTVDVAEA